MSETDQTIYEWLRVAIPLDIGSFVISCLSLGVTLKLLYDVGKLKKSYLLKARLPEVLEKAEEGHAELFEILGDWSADDAEHMFLNHLAEVRQQLSHISARLPQDERREVRRFLQQHFYRRVVLRKIPIRNVEKMQAWHLYNELSGILVRLKEVERDGKWR